MTDAIVAASGFSRARHLDEAEWWLERAKRWLSDEPFEVGGYKASPLGLPPVERARVVAVRLRVAVEQAEFESKCAICGEEILRGRGGVGARLLL